MSTKTLAQTPRERVVDVWVEEPTGREHTGRGTRGAVEITPVPHPSPALSRGRVVGALLVIGPLIVLVFLSLIHI